jgi:hypothetical protein
VIHVMAANAAKEKTNMSIESENTRTSVAEAPATNGPRKANKAKPAKKAGRTEKLTSRPKADRSKKKAEVIEMMKRVKGATLPEIMKATASCLDDLYQRGATTNVRVVTAAAPVGGEYADVGEKPYADQQKLACTAQREGRCSTCRQD